MFKHFLMIPVIIFIITASYYIIKNVIISNHTLILNESIIKYPLSKMDILYFNKNSTPTKLSELTGKIIFYTSLSWATKNNNYIHDQLIDKYYIIDKDYYYYIPNDRYKINIGKDIFVNLLY